MIDIHELNNALIQWHKVPIQVSELAKKICRINRGIYINYECVLPVDLSEYDVSYTARTNDGLYSYDPDNIFIKELMSEIIHYLSHPLHGGISYYYKNNSVRSYMSYIVPNVVESKHTPNETLYVPEYLIEYMNEVCKAQNKLINNLNKDIKILMDKYKPYIVGITYCDGIYIESHVPIEIEGIISDCTNFRDHYISFLHVNYSNQFNYRCMVAYIYKPCYPHRHKDLFEGYMKPIDFFQFK